MQRMKNTFELLRASTACPLRRVTADLGDDHGESTVETTCVIFILVAIAVGVGVVVVNLIA